MFVPGAGQLRQLLNIVMDLVSKLLLVFKWTSLSYKDFLTYVLRPHFVHLYV